VVVQVQTVISTLAADLAAALDPCLLAERVSIMPDPWQAEVLRTAAPRMLLNCCRQSGKSTITALLAVHTALYQAPSLVLLLSPSQRQSAELFRKAADCYHSLGQPVPSDAESALRLELANGSRIVSLPGKEGTVRGFSGVGLLIVDEASRVPDELYFAVRPMLAVSGGRLLALSTPFGKRGWWHQEWSEGRGWERVEVQAPKVPRISAAFLAEEHATMPAWTFNQEYLCRFEEAEDVVFRYEDVQGALSHDLPPLWS
jgi:hypothetical protein